MSVKPLIEVLTEGIEFVIEDKSSNKRGYFIQGPFLQSDQKNRNGRIYPFNTLKNEVERYNEQYVKANRALGELGHPDTTSVNPERASHKITNLTQDGKNFIGKAKILDTPYGKIVKNFMDEGILLGVSSRGFGSVEERGHVKIVGEDFQLSTVDIVHDPSGYHCFVENIMESREYYFENGILKEKDYDTVKNMVRNTSHNEILEGKLLENIDKFLKSL